MDRLPFEVQDRLYGDAPELSREHHVSPVRIVMASKKSGTFRPFARFEPPDLLLYQALVDQLASAIEATLGPRDRVMAYRQTLDGADNPFSGAPTFVDYADRVDEIIAQQIPDPRRFSPFAPAKRRHPGFVLSTDISGYFMHIDVDELEKALLSTEAPSDVVRDLGDLLRNWRMSGVRGLPQGVRASSPLANFYLTPLDAMLELEGVDWVRWMDDVTITASKFADARRILDTAERLLYERGLTLNSGKTTIRRASPTASPIPPDALSRRKEATRDEIAALIEAGYIDPDDAPEPAEIDLELAIEELDELLDASENQPLPEKFQSRMTSAIRDLENLGIAHRLSDLPRALTRAPDLMYVGLRYVAEVASHDAEAAVDVFLRLLGADNFLREYERLSVCRAGLSMPATRALAAPFATLAETDPSDLVRARALLTWGLHSASDDFSLADHFWEHTSAAWKGYALVAIQRKKTAPRDDRYERWSGEGRYLGRLATELKSSPIRWTRT